MRVRVLFEHFAVCVAWRVVGVECALDGSDVDAGCVGDVAGGDGSQRGYDELGPCGVGDVGVGLGVVGVGESDEPVFEVVCFFADSSQDGRGVNGAWLEQPVGCGCDWSMVGPISLSRLQPVDG
jgi:hypothetical protein